jgi:hypothetical protein
MKHVIQCIQAGVPTHNGRIYPLEVLKKAIKEFNGKGVYLYSNPSVFPPDEQDLIGTVVDGEMTEDGHMVANVTIHQEVLKSKELAELMEIEFDIFPVCTGTIIPGDNPKNCYVDIVELKGFSIEPKV